MGITCKPTGKFGSMMKKMENEQAKAKAAKAAAKAARKDAKKS